MANVDFPMGFKPVQSEYGSSPRILPGDHFSDGSAAIGENDLVKKDGSGRYLTITAAGDNPVAVAGNYIAASDTTTELKLFALNGTVFECQVDDGTLTDDTAIGNFFDVVISTLDTVRLRSTQELDGNSSADDTVELLALSDRPGNAWGAQVNVLVRVRVDANTAVVATT